ncbi:GNAT family N-acetyltransferase [Thalassobacillus sp. CUG 92003]|uniref:GNAT family N-acetyltransferase n=1 Tax=Thalassobacillus sp. CUG 92003 TaxID=2736641 RepID=UPI0015E71537
MNQTISFRPFEVNRDIGLLHRWMHHDHVIPFWQLNLPFDRFQNHVERALADRHQSLYIGELDGVPMSYWESYWAKQDVVGSTFNPEPSDQGVHLLIGDQRYLGKGLALPLLRAMVAFQFTHPDTNRVIAEPDIRNEKMIHVFEKCGFTPVKSIELPDKTGLLMWCEREQFEARCSYVSATL